MLEDELLTMEELDEMILAEVSGGWVSECVCGLSATFFPATFHHLFRGTTHYYLHLCPFRHTFLCS